MTNKERYALSKTIAIAIVTGGPIACQQCGFSNTRALQFDHITEIGDRSLRHTSSGSERGGSQMIRAIIKGEIDPTILQVLCANCHCLKGTN